LIADFVSNALDLFTGPSGDSDTCAVLREEERNRAADTASASSDKSDFVVEHSKQGLDAD
jgi:hypothetical protein